MRVAREPDARPRTASRGRRSSRRPPGLGVSVEELASYAVLYYLADGDSGRIARRLPPPRPGEPHPLGRLLDD